MHNLWMDCETFGLDPRKNPLATVYMAVYDGEKFIEDLNLKVKPDSMEGLVADLSTEKVHGINFDSHMSDPETITYSEANKIIQSFLVKHKIPKARKSFKPCGQNVVFDINYLKNTIFDQESWDKIIHYRYLDTLVILNYLQDIDLVPSDLGNLSSLVEYFGLKTGEFHDARADVKMTVQVYKKMKNLVLSLKKGNISSNTNLDILSVIEE